MGNFFSRTKNIENKFINKIVSLYSSQLALLSNSEIEIISQDTLETNLIIKGNNFINIFQISNGNIIIFSDLKIEIISLIDNNEYTTIQEIENDNNIIHAKLLETKDELFFVKNNINNDILFDIYNNTNSSNEKIDKKNNFVINNNSMFIDVEYLPQKNEFIFLTNNKLKFYDREKFNLKHEITNEHFHLDFERDVLCLLDDAHVLICTHKNLYILNINNYEFVSIIRHDNIIKGINKIKKDLNGNIILTANNTHHIKGFFPPKHFLIVYKYNKNEKKLDKIYNETLTNESIKDFACFNENNIAFVLDYFPFFGDKTKEYLKISSYNY